MTAGLESGGARDAPLRALELLRVLVEHGVDFVVIGGFAVAAHGYERATKDVDVVPSPEIGNLARLVAALASLEARPFELKEFRLAELPVELDLDGLAKGGNWCVATRFGRLDVMQFVDRVLETADDYAALRGNALVVDIPGVGAVPYAGLDDLLLMKEAAGRDQDLVDIRAIREARGER